MTQTVTHTGFGASGNNGADGVQYSAYPGQKGLKRALRSENDHGATSHNPEVAGSSPAAATRKPLISYEISGFSIKKVQADFSVMRI